MSVQTKCLLYIVIVNHSAGVSHLSEQTQYALGRFGTNERGKHRKIVRSRNNHRQWVVDNTHYDNATVLPFII